MNTNRSFATIFQGGVLFLFALTTAGYGLGQPPVPTVMPVRRIRRFASDQEVHYVAQKGLNVDFVAQSVDQ